MIESRMPVDQFISMGTPNCLSNVSNFHSQPTQTVYYPTQEAMTEKDRLENMLLATASVAIIQRRERLK